MGINVKFTKTTHQIWSCHVTLASNSENVYFLLHSVLNFRKSYQIWWKLAQEQKSYKQKITWGWKTPPPLMLIGLSFQTFTIVNQFGLSEVKYPRCHTCCNQVKYSGGGIVIRYNQTGLLHV